LNNEKNNNVANACVDVVPTRLGLCFTAWKWEKKGQEMRTRLILK